MACFEGAAPVDEAEGATIDDHVFDLAPGSNRAARVKYVAGVGAGDGVEVDDAGAGRVKRGYATRVRLDPFDVRGVDPAQAGHAVGLGPSLELLQTRELGAAGRKYQLSALLAGDVALGAVGVKLAPSLHAQARLE